MSEITLNEAYSQLNKYEAEIHLLHTASETASINFTIHFQLKLSPALDKTLIKKSLEKTLGDFYNLVFVINEDGKKQSAKLSDVYSENIDIETQENKRSISSILFDLTENHDHLNLLVTTHRIAFDFPSTQSFISVFLSYLHNPKWERSERIEFFSENQQPNKFWQSYFAEQIPTLDLPLTKPTAVVSSPDHDSASIVLNKDLPTLNELIAKVDVELPSLLYSVFVLFIGRISNSNELVIDYLEDRHRGHSNYPHGNSSRSIPILNTLSNAETLQSFISNIQKNIESCSQRGNFLLSDLNESLVNSAGGKIFPVNFNYKEICVEHKEGIDLKFVDQQFGFYDLSLEVVRTTEELTLNFHYDTNKFELEIIELWLDDLAFIIQSIAKQIDTPLNQLEIIGNKTKNILSKINSTSVPVKGNYLHSYLEEYAKTNPNQTAVVCDDRTLSYEDLDNLSSYFASELIKHGAHKGDLIGICLHRTSTLIIGLFGILKSGCGYLPLDPEFPSERIDFILKDANAPILITEKSLEDSVSEYSGKIIHTDNLDLDCAKTSNKPLVSDIPKESIAYTIYTSGSTGKPKGVQVSHANAVNFLSSMKSKPGFNAQDTLLALTTICFDISVLEIFLPSFSGGQFVLATKQQSTNGTDLNSLILEHKISMVQATPATWRLILNDNLNSAITREIKGLIGGEALPRDLISPLLNYVTELWNMYGPTETTVWSTMSRITTDITAPLIGSPIDNTSISIVNSDKQLLPIGVPGELLIGGKGVTAGYLGRPELNAKAFIQFNGERWYHTGDKASISLKNYQLKYLGRMDNQVKIRGYRIELGEIENKITTFTGINECIAVAKELSPGDTRLIAYYSLANIEAIDEQSLRAFLGERLPSYMIPQHFVLLSEFPKTPNKKIDRKALASRDIDIVNTQATIKSSKPSSAIQSTLLELFKTHLKLHHINLEDNFFEIGGHSLIAMQIVTDLSKKLEVRIPTSIFLQGATILDLERSVNSLVNGLSKPKAKKLNKKTTGQALYFIHDGNGETLLYQQLSELLPYPCYGIDPEPGYNLPTKHLTIRSMAIAYTELIESVDPVGPYKLAGLCFGGYLAFEVSTILQQKGKTVELLALLDTPSTQAKKFSFRIAKDRLNRLQRSATNINPVKAAALFIKKLASVISWEASKLIRSASTKTKISLAQCFIAYKKAPPQILCSLTIRELLDHAESCYKEPAHSKADILLLKATEKDTNFEKISGVDDTPYCDIYCEDDFGWRRLGCKVSTIQIPGGHSSMLQSDGTKFMATVIAKKLKARS